MGLKFIYQQQLTKYLVKFYKNSNKYVFSKSEMSLDKIIMYSRLLPDQPTIDIFLQQGLIYLNGKNITNLKALIARNDLIQLVVST